MSRIYISGAITGVENYRDIFAEAEKKLINAGYQVVNPARVDFDCLTWDEYMKIDMALLDMCDAVVMLDGWKQSTGACIEHGYALGRDKIVFNSIEVLIRKEKTNV